MSKVLVVFGASGHQGGSTVSYVVNHPTLSKEFKVRAVTRDPSNAKFDSFKKQGVEVVKGDFDDENSLKQALKDAHTVFGVTLTVFAENGHEVEVKQGKAIVDAAIEAGAKYFIWSSGVSSSLESKGKLDNISVIDAKYDVMQYIKTRPITGIYYFPGSFLQNFHTQLRPVPLGNGNYGIYGRFSVDAHVPYIDVTDTGKFLGAVLENPDKFADQFICGAEGLYPITEVVERIGKVSGKNVTYHQASEEDFVSKFPPFLQGFAPTFVKFFRFISEFGYYGPDLKTKVEYWSKVPREKLTTIEEFFQKNPLEFK